MGLVPLRSPRASPRHVDVGLRYVRDGGCGRRMSHAFVQVLDGRAAARPVSGFLSACVASQLVRAQESVQ